MPAHYGFVELRKWERQPEPEPDYIRLPDVDTPWRREIRDVPMREDDPAIPTLPNWPDEPSELPPVTPGG